MSPTERAPRRARTWEHALLGLLLAGTFVFPLALLRGKSATFDEVAHLPAGYSYLTTGLFKINPQHPPLIKEICAVPLLFMNLKMPVDRETLRRANPGLTYQWGFGRRFLYSQDADRILFWGRVPAVLLSFGLALMVALWARRLWGPFGALLASTLYLLDPTLTAHAQLVTNDVGLAFFATLFLFVLRGYADSPTRPRLIASGITLGLALGSKFSAIILIPIALVLLLLAARREPDPAAAAPHGRRGGRRRGSAPSGKQDLRIPVPLGPWSSFALMLPLAAVVVWALYFFPADPFVYLKGLSSVNRDHDPSYLPYFLGEMKPGRWYSYFLIAYLVKTPLPALLMELAALVLFFRG